MSESPTITDVAVYRMSEKDDGDILAFVAIGRVKELDRKAYIDFKATRSFVTDPHTSLTDYATDLLRGWAARQPEWKDR